MHGGATAVDTASAVEPGFEAKSLRETAEKEAIAARAATLVRPGMAIAVTAGTTTWTLARHLAAIADLTVVTNSLKVAEVLHAQHRPDLTVVLTGGLRTPSDGLVGPVAVQAIRSLHVDMVIMGVHGIDARAGLTTPNLLEAETNRAMVEASTTPGRGRRPHQVGRRRAVPHRPAVGDQHPGDRRPARSPTAIATLDEQVDELILIPAGGSEETS